MARAFAATSKWTLAKYPVLIELAGALLEPLSAVCHAWRDAVFMLGYLEQRSGYLWARAGFSSTESEFGIPSGKSFQ